MSSTIRLGSHGPDVVAWQKIIGVTPDGDFGPKTRAATKKWQAAHGLEPDGVVGPKTWAKAHHPNGGGGGNGNGGGGNSGGGSQGGGSHGDLVYPLWHPALAPFSTGARYFGAGRSGGRLHAGIDLLAPYLAKIRAIADGTVIQSPYPFYEGTNALEVRHPGVGVVRYGEISSAKVISWRSGDHVKKGQLIAYVGRLDSSGASMIHFELYSGSKSGALTVRGNPPYQRRSDLVNPSSLMKKLYSNSF